MTSKTQKDPEITRREEQHVCEINMLICPEGVRWMLGGGIGEEEEGVCGGGTPKFTWSPSEGPTLGKGGGCLQLSTAGC